MLTVYLGWIACLSGPLPSFFLKFFLKFAGIIRTPLWIEVIWMELPVNCAKAMNMLAKTKAQPLDVKMSWLQKINT